MIGEGDAKGKRRKADEEIDDPQHRGKRQLIDPQGMDIHHLAEGETHQNASR